MATVDDVRFLNISTNCKTVAGRIAEADFSGIELDDVLKIYIYDQSKTVQIYLTSSDWSVADNVLTFTTTSTTALTGVVSVELHDNTTIDYDEANSGANSTLMTTIYTVAPCTINCCIAKLTDAAIECHCKCDKCKEDLLRAEKVMLMLQGATFAAEQESNYDHAVNMYNKANTLCTEVCACGC
jgi:hypothetical protein